MSNLILVDFSSSLTSMLQFFGNSVSVYSSTSQCLMGLEDPSEHISVQFSANMYGILLNILNFWIFAILIILLGKITKKTLKNIQNLLTCAFITFYTLVQPGILFQAFSFLFCSEFGDQSYSNADYNISCSSDYYMTTVLPSMLLILLFLGLLIPFFLSWKIRQFYLQDQTNKVNPPLNIS